MFHIYLKLPQFKCYGVKALDMRRKLGLPDDSCIEMSDFELKCEVDEQFARKNFARGSRHHNSKVKFRDLRPGDLAAGNKGSVNFNIQMSEDRCLELWRISNKGIVSRAWDCLVRMFS